MANYTYEFTTNGLTGVITLTVDTTTLYTYSANGSFQGYPITGISGSFNGQTITGLLASNNTTQGGNVLTNDGAANGGGVAGTYDNVFWLNDTQGNGGTASSGKASIYGIDNRGFAFTAGGTDYRISKQSTSNTNFIYQSNGTASQATTFDAADSNVPCYVTGTRIRTARGEVAVEDLTVGDLAVTAEGAERPIRWIGRSTLPCRGRADRLPVRIAAGAFGPGKPARDLLVSPAHAICVDLMGEVLIPAIRLVNGTTITQVAVEHVTYWHVELDGHDILLAENLPAESYLDCGNRAFFADAGVTDRAALPDARPEGPLAFCRPFHEDGALVDLVRARLEERAGTLGWSLVDESLAGLHVVADGAVIRPDVADLTARFVLPADARDVRLVSDTSVPAHVLPGSSDDRRLGVSLGGLTIDDGLTGARAIALDDPRLGAGLHPAEGDEAGACWRWTDGAATLPAALWEGCRGVFFLRLTLARPALPRWVGPRETAGVIDLSEIRRRA
ncbi:Hint domain-containing protein [Methylobacterium sp. J-068]|uniref:Hint domain-containing protein n=1 Tax=Methylobacterium sp. J-068 TaxID=2836649 RepID=UPI001FB92C7C|nr:Hint domain-containing protein [Methylobacterium sp. J-068]MCJ2032836.1 Hint domain-containing protein [Methylobacterium sp. J-068]